MYTPIIRTHFGTLMLAYSTFSGNTKFENMNQFSAYDHRVYFPTRAVALKIGRSVADDSGFDPTTVEPSFLEIS